MDIQVLSPSPEDTFHAGRILGGLLKGDELLLMLGELGAGKTLFSKGVAAALNINPDDVVSPTFTLMNQLNGRFTLFHFDLYRVGEHISGWLPEIDDYLDLGVLIIEWAQYLDRSYFQMKQALEIHFSVINDDKREIRFLNVPEELAKSLTQALKNMDNHSENFPERT